MGIYNDKNGASLGIDKRRSKSKFSTLIAENRHLNYFCSLEFIEARLSACHQLGLLQLISNE